MLIRWHNSHTWYSILNAPTALSVYKYSHDLSFILVDLLLGHRAGCFHHFQGHIYTAGSGSCWGTWSPRRLAGHTWADGQWAPETANKPHSIQLWTRNNRSTFIKVMSLIFVLYYIAVFVYRSTSSLYIQPILSSLKIIPAIFFLY